MVVVFSFCGIFVFVDMVVFVVIFVGCSLVVCGCVFWVVIIYKVGYVGFW